MVHSRLSIWVQPSFTKTPWYRELIEGLRSELSVRKLPLHVSEHPQALPDAGVELVMLAGETLSWFERMVPHISGHGLRILTVSSTPIRAGGNISSVSLNRNKDMQLLLHYLHDAGRRKIAFWGVNEYSPTDGDRLEGYLTAVSALELPLSEKDVFINHCDAAECAGRLLARIDEYDSVIASNDLYAVYLLDYLKERGIPVPERLFLAGFGNTALSQLCSPAITTTTLNHWELGRQAAKQADYLIRNPDVSCSTVEIASSCHVRQSTACIPFNVRLPLAASRHTPHSVSSYDDLRIQQLAALEACLNNPADENRQVLCRITSPQTLGDLADSLFMAESTLKTRLGKLYGQIGVSNRQELCALLEAYAPELKKEVNG